MTKLKVKSYQKISSTQGNFSGQIDPGDEFAVSLANLGDMDGDGVSDLAAGAWQDDDGGFNRGAVWIIFMNSITVGPMVTPEPSEEGGAVVASASFSDPGDDDSPFTCTVDYGSGPETGTVSGTTCTGPSHTYGDNGSFPVVVRVTDKDSGEGVSPTATHVVDNVAPTITSVLVPLDPIDIANQGSF